MNKNNSNAVKGGQNPHKKKRYDTRKCLHPMQNWKCLTDFNLIVLDFFIVQVSTWIAMKGQLMISMFNDGRREMIEAGDELLCSITFNSFYGFTHLLHENN